MDKLSKKLDKFYTQVHNQKKAIRSHSKEFDDLSDTSIDIQMCVQVPLFQKSQEIRKKYNDQFKRRLMIIIIHSYQYILNILQNQVKSYSPLLNLWFITLKQQKRNYHL
ncbi:unnamed protein product (macronuclear) [Paramecium tetraurelia]|uniref:Uncharacterized protein n=1 Tax=Paramecium tetraurelia TaxID=5888 RepID=A0BMR3_PARTE|nr:uncharacterized protein GSPATT00030466001 [Paramecium tetraurelia]CAK59830.1 unnamed protein product [Paramecium tetraurelia]|eukprot:XP_001427228.1 hypothetical protein (macronuclear) [Paramecium tetraurelia strain d4-2]